MVSYLEQTYPAEPRRFIDWVEHYGGVRLTLDQMAADPRKYIFDIQQIMFLLVEWVDEDKLDPYYEFANFFHMCEFYQEAMSIVDQLMLGRRRRFSFLNKVHAS